MAQDQTELWQMACTFQGSTMCDCNLESPAWDWMCADVCKAVRGRDSDKITLSPTSTLVAHVWYSVEHQQSVWAAKLFDALKHQKGRRFPHGSVHGHHRNCYFCHTCGQQLFSSSFIYCLNGKAIFW